MNLVSTRARTVNGTPSLTLKPRDGGGVVASLRRNSPNAGMLTDLDMAPLQRLLEAAQQDAESLSQGPLTLARLRAMGHPYGKGQKAPNGKRRRGLGHIQGSRQGVSNINIVNTQGGDLAGSYSHTLRRDGGGVTLSITNTTPQAAYTMLGTPTLRAHGPLPFVLRRQTQAINREWQKLGRLGAARKRQAEALAMVGSLSLGDLSFGAVSTQGPTANGIQRAYQLGFGSGQDATGGLE